MRLNNLEFIVVIFCIVCIVFGAFHFTGNEVTITKKCDCKSEQWIQDEIHFIVKTQEQGSITHDRLGNLLDQINCRRKCK